MTASEQAAAEWEERVRIPVWDWPVRGCHWALVLLVTASVVTVEIGGNAMEWHIRSGFAILTLVLFRILWGFFGSRHARFSSFLGGPVKVIAYLKALKNGAKAPQVGHSPVGGWAVVALLLVLLFQASSGLFSNDDIATDGPLVKLISKDLSDAITSWHRRNAWILFALVGVHIAANLFYLVALKENLIRPMITGTKELPRRYAEAAADGAGNAKALVLLALCGFAVWWIVKKL
jgi:cytochrome b